MVEEGCEVLGHDRLLQRPLIVGDQVGDSEEKGDNRIEEEKGQWVDKQFPPDQSENILDFYDNIGWLINSTYIISIMTFESLQARKQIFTTFHLRIVLFPRA